MHDQVSGSFQLLQPRSYRMVGKIHLTLLWTLAALGLLAPQLLGAEDPPASLILQTSPSKPEAAKPETSELFFEGYVPYRTFKFAGGEIVSKVYNAGVEYDMQNTGAYLTRAGHFWDFPAKLVHARLTYVAEILPLELLRQPVSTDKWGDPLTPARKTVPGLAISPLGFRWMWRDGKAFRPLWTVKLGEAVFTQKAMSWDAAYANFTINSSAGFQARLTSTIDLRLGFQYYHVSNAYLAAQNPGLDTLGPNFGIVYHLSTFHKRW